MTDYPGASELLSLHDDDVAIVSGDARDCASAGYFLVGCARSNRRPCTVISSSLNHGAGLSPLR